MRLTQYDHLDFFSSTFIDDAENVMMNSPYQNIREQYVYIAQAGNFIKIGATSMNPLKRVLAMQSGCPLKIKLICKFIGNFDLESRLHAYFKEYSARPDSERYIRRGELDRFLISIETQVRDRYEQINGELLCI